MRTTVDAVRALLAKPGQSWRTAGWAVSSSRHLAAQLGAEGFDALNRLSPPPPGASERAIVVAALRVVRATCLVRAAVLQRWDAEHGRPRSLHIGVRPVDGRVDAHAWLDGERVDENFVELHLHPAPSPTLTQALTTG